MIESSSLSRTLPASHDPALVRPVFFTLKHEIQAACGSSPTLHVAWLRTPGTTSDQASSYLFFPKPHGIKDACLITSPSVQKDVGPSK